jgi:hypothetical protein
VRCCAGTLGALISTVRRELVVVHRTALLQSQADHYRIQPREGPRRRWYLDFEESRHCMEHDPCFVCKGDDRPHLPL